MPQCVNPPPPSSARVCLQHSPCDHIGSKAEDEGADEGADLPCRSLSSPLLLLQATLADTGKKNAEFNGIIISWTDSGED